MKKIVRTILLLILTITTSTNVCFADLSLNSAGERFLSYESTQTNFSKLPNQVLEGKFIVLGDSYAYLLSTYSTYYFNYIVHQGYNISKIYNEFIDKINYGEYKYAFLFIGPNDFMEQTLPESFKVNLRKTITTLNNKGMRVILASYLDIDYNSAYKDVFLNKKIKCYVYSNIVRELSNELNVLYVDILDLISIYGRMENDFVHPAKPAYKPIMDRVISLIEIENMYNNHLNSFTP